MTSVILGARTTEARERRVFQASGCQSTFADETDLAVRAICTASNLICMQHSVYYILMNSLGDLLPNIKGFHRYPTGSFSAADVANGDLLCVGGTMPGVRNLFLTADFDDFESFFCKARDLHSNISENTEPCSQWLRACGSDADPDLFLALHAVQSTLTTEYPGLSEKPQTRKTFYSKDTSALLSQIVNASAAECAEIALLAHACLNRMGFHNDYISGAVALRDDEEYPEEHCYVRIPCRGGLVIFDPSNPVSSNQGTFPALYKAGRKQAEAFERHAARGSAFIEVADTLTHKRAYFGVHDGTGIDLAHYTVDANGTLLRQFNVPRRAPSRRPSKALHPKAPAAP